MAFPKIFSKLFKNAGAGKELNSEIIPFATEISSESSAEVAAAKWVKDKVVGVELYVDCNASTSGDGITAESPVKTINEAFAIAKQRTGFGATIHISAGTYDENIDITNGETYHFIINGSISVGVVSVYREASLKISSENDAEGYNFNTNRIYVSDHAMFYTFVKSVVNCVDSSYGQIVDISGHAAAIFIAGLETIANSGRNVVGIRTYDVGRLVIFTELTMRSGTTENSVITTALQTYNDSIVGIYRCLSNISCTGSILYGDVGAKYYITNTAGDANNTFTGVTEATEPIRALNSCIMRFENVTLNLTTSSVSTSTKYFFNINDCSSIRFHGVNLNLNSSVNVDRIFSVFLDSTVVYATGNINYNCKISSSGSNVYCGNNSSFYIGKNVNIAGTVTGGSKFYVDRGGAIDIAGNSAGLNRLPGTNSGTIASSSYGYYG